MEHIESLIELLSSTRFSNTVYLDNLYDILCNCRNKPLFFKHCEMRGVPTENYINRKIKNHKLSLITLMSYARQDSPLGYSIWLNLSAQSSNHDEEHRNMSYSPIAVLVHYLCLDFVHIERNNDIETYYYENNHLIEDHGNFRLIERIRTLILTERIMYRNFSNLVAKSFDKYLDNAKGQKRFINDIKRALIVEIDNPNTELNFRMAFKFEEISTNEINPLKEELLQIDDLMLEDLLFSNKALELQQKINKLYEKIDLLKQNFLSKLENNEERQIKIFFKDCVLLITNNGLQIIDGTIQDYSFDCINLNFRSIENCHNNLFNGIFSDEILRKLSMLFKIPSTKNKLWICGPYRSGKSYLLGFIEELFGYTITQLPTHFDHHCMQRNLSFNRHIFIITLNNGENDYYPEYISAFPDLIFIIVSNFLPNRNLDETEIITLERKDERNLILPDCKNEDVLAQFASSILNNL